MYRKYLYIQLNPEQSIQVKLYESFDNNPNLIFKYSNLQVIHNILDRKLKNKLDNVILVIFSKLILSVFASIYQLINVPLANALNARKFNVFSIFVFLYFCYFRFNVVTNVVDVQTTSLQRQNDVVCLLGPVE